jgi:hypothetical protein
MKVEWSQQTVPESAWHKSSYSSGGGGECVEVAVWLKSSHSGAEGGDCVEIAWTKSSHSSGEGGECVEVAAHARTVHVRDSKNKTGAILSLTPETWAAFVPFAAQR